jgi:type I restriction enzyme R subunit
MTDIRYTQDDSGYSGFSENIVEDATTEILRDLGYLLIDAAPDHIEPSVPPERTAYADVVLLKRLEAAVARINPAIPAGARGAAIKQLLVSETPSLVEENRRIHRLLTDGVDVEYHDAEGLLKGDKVWLLAFDDLGNNDFAVTRQFTVVEGRHTRRADVVIFVNGLPLAIIEMKNAAGEAATIETAIRQLETYRGANPLALPHERRACRVRRTPRAHRLAHGRRGPLHALAHGDRRARRFHAGRPARDGDAAARRLRQAAASFAHSRLHCVR